MNKETLIKLWLSLPFVAILAAMLVRAAGLLENVDFGPISMMAFGVYALLTVLTMIWSN